MKSIIHFLKNWTLPIAMLSGVAGYFIYVNIPFLAPTRPFVNRAVDFLQPVLIFLMLFLSFCKISLHDLRPCRWHLWLLLVQAGSFTLLGGILLLFRDMSAHMLMEGAMICLICPTATAGAVITQRLGGNAAHLATYTILINLVTAFLVPLIVPLVHPHPGLAFANAFALILGIIPGFILWSEYLNFLPMYYATPEGVAVYMMETALKVVKYSMIPLIAIAIFDVWQSRYAYNESLKMTKDEVKDERKQSEGDPVIKNKQKQKMMEVMARRMLADVPKADVVVTNPTHIAVALSYDPAKAPAPVVLAKGVNRLAEKIKEVARENRVPIRENVPLARALYKSVEVGEMIPEDLYKAVAAVLASIWRLKPRNR